MSFLILMVVLVFVMYVLMIRPQRQRQREHQTMVDSAGVGEDVLTTGGIYGTVVQAEGDDLVVEIADGVTVHMTRRGIAAVLPPEEDEEDADEEDLVDAEPLEEPDEVPVTVGEEPVMSPSDQGSAPGERR